MTSIKPVLNAMGVAINKEDRHVPIKEALETVGVTRNTIDAMIAKGQFPKKHSVTPGRKAFWLSELEEWNKTGAWGWYERYGKIRLANEERARHDACPA